MKYRKKPVVIEAFQYDGDLKDIDGQYYAPDWAVKAYECGTMYYGELDGQPGELFVKTLEGVYHASVGDYIIQGVNGELYPCKPDIFEKTYEAADFSPKIRIESDGERAIIHLNGERIRSTLLDFSFHGDIENGIHIKWDGRMQRFDKDGNICIENDEVVTEEFHYDSRESKKSD